MSSCHYQFVTKMIMIISFDHGDHGDHGDDDYGDDGKHMRKK